MTAAQATALQAMASSELSVILRDNGDETAFAEAVAGRAHNARGVASSEAAWPEAVLTAKSVAAVQEVIQFGTKHNIQISLRSGAHSWHPRSWLRGDGTVLLDLGHFNAIEVDELKGSVSVGPGATGSDVLKALPQELFFPCGHCPGVPVGGFVLGGGYGLGFPKYGLTSMLVTSVDVVLSTGEAIVASVDSEDPREGAVCSLLSGSYTGFPGVITKYHFKNLPRRPQGVFKGMAIFDLRSDWKKALSHSLDVQFRGDDDARAVETVLVFTHAPPPIAEATGVEVVAIVALTVYGDTEQEGRDIWNKYSGQITDTLVPIGEPEHVPVETIPNGYADFYPAKARYETQAHLGKEQVYDMSDDEIATLIEPVVELWLSGAEAPPPPSHTLFVPMHPAMKSQAHGGRETASGFSPSLFVSSYATYYDAKLDAQYKAQLLVAHQRMIDSPHFRTEMPEGNVAMLGADSCFTEAAFESVQQTIAFLDPSGVFAGFPRET